MIILTYFNIILTFWYGENSFSIFCAFVIIIMFVIRIIRIRTKFYLNIILRSTIFVNNINY